MHLGLTKLFEKMMLWIVFAMFSVHYISACANVVRRAEQKQSVLCRSDVLVYRFANWREKDPLVNHSFYPITLQSRNGASALRSGIFVFKFSGNL